MGDEAISSGLFVLFELLFTKPSQRISVRRCELRIYFCIACQFLYARNIFPPLKLLWQSCELKKVRIQGLIRNGCLYDAIGNFLSILLVFTLPEIIFYNLIASGHWFAVVLTNACSILFQACLTEFISATFTSPPLYINEKVQESQQKFGKSFFWLIEKCFGNVFEEKNWNFSETFLLEIS